MTAAAGRPAGGPVALSERIVSVDIVRGFALWGVLLINMMNFGALNRGRWPAPIDQFAYWAQRFFFEQKSWRLFSFLFGLGFALLMMRASARGARFLPMYVRRLAILFGFGFLNYLFYFGDIVSAYAILGVGLLIFRRWSPRWILVVAALLLLVSPVVKSIDPLIAGRPDPPDPEVAAEVARTVDEAARTFDPVMSDLGGA